MSAPSSPLTAGRRQRPEAWHKVGRDGRNVCHDGDSTAVLRQQPHNGEINTSNLMTAQASTRIVVSNPTANQEQEATSRFPYIWLSLMGLVKRHFFSLQVLQRAKHSILKNLLFKPLHINLATNRQRALVLRDYVSISANKTGLPRFISIPWCTIARSIKALSVVLQ